MRLPPPRKIRLRAARPSDVNALLALESLFPSDRLTRAALLRFLRVPSARLWVAEQSGLLVGSLVLLLRSGADYGRIYSVVVAPIARGQGLGTRLVATAERHTRAAGRSRLRLEVRVDNQPARSLYEQRGYAEVAHLDDYYEDGAAGLRLEKVLRRH